jgi:hypothetical protein
VCRDLGSLVAIANSVAEGPVLVVEDAIRSWAIGKISATKASSKTKESGKIKQLW